MKNRIEPCAECEDAYSNTVDPSPRRCVCGRASAMVEDRQLQGIEPEGYRINDIQFGSHR